MTSKVAVFQNGPAPQTGRFALETHRSHNLALRHAYHLTTLVCP